MVLVGTGGVQAGFPSAGGPANVHHNFLAEVAPPPKARAATLNGPTF